MQTFTNGASAPAYFPYGRIETVNISANRTVPQPPGTSITWTAIPSGDISACEYKWFVHNGSCWEVAANWSESDTFTWRPAFANPRYRIAVWVRPAGRTRDEAEAVTEAAFAIDGASTTRADADAIHARYRPAPVPQVSTVTLRANVSSPQPPGTTIIWTAAATGGGTEREFKWFVYDGSAWTSATPWSTSDTFSWTPQTANPRYRIAVWARGAGSTSDYFEACAEVGFAIEEQA